MAGIDPTGEAEIWLQDMLSSDAGVTAVFGDRIFRHPAPRTTTEPFLTYDLYYAMPDTRVVGETTIWSTVRYLIRGWTSGNNDNDLIRGAKAVYDAVHGKFGATTNADIVSCIRDRPVSEVQELNSIQHLYRGAEYVIQITAKSL